VQPRAEVYVNGVLQGRTPPLTELHLPAGIHRIALRQAGYRPVDVTYELRPAQQATVAYTLQKLPDLPPPPAEKRRVPRRKPVPS
jgi:hypothetical protein